MERKVYRSAVTGEFVTEEEAQTNPRETVCEKVAVNEEFSTNLVRMPLVLWGPLTGYVRRWRKLRGPICLAEE